MRVNPLAVALNEQTMHAPFFSHQKLGIFSAFLCGQLCFAIKMLANNLEIH
jgi:hypothetical protein